MHPPWAAAMASTSWLLLVKLQASLCPWPAELFQSGILASALFPRPRQNQSRSSPLMGRRPCLSQFGWRHCRNNNRSLAGARTWRSRRSQQTAKRVKSARRILDSFRHGCGEEGFSYKAGHIDLRYWFRRHQRQRERPSNASPSLSKSGTLRDPVGFIEGSHGNSSHTGGELACP